MPRPLGLAIALTTLAAALFTPASAPGAIYTQYVCELPDGSPAPADGFDGYATQTFGTYGDNCLTGGSLYATVAGASNQRARAGLQYSPHSDTSIFGVRVVRDTSGIGQPGAATYDFVNTEDHCYPDAGCPNGISGGTFHWEGMTSYLDFIVQCPSSGCNAPGHTPTINLRRLEIDLNDAGDPTFSVAPSGGLFDTSRTLHGVEPVTFTAKDAGGGVASVSVLVDGVERDRRVVDDDNGSCRQPYTMSSPCKAEVAASYGFDTTQLADGKHDVALVVRDATEVNNVTYGPVPVTVDNRPPAPAAEQSPPDAAAGSSFPQFDASSLAPTPAPANGSHASPRARIAGVRGTRTIRYGSTTLIRGRLQDEDGHAIGNAVLDVLASLHVPGAKHAVVGHITTTETGSFAYRFRAGASRDVTIAYRLRADDPTYAATQRTTVLVRAALRLSRSHATLHNGQLLKLTTKVLGPHVRRRAATIAFQVKVGTRWRTFAATSIDGHGVARIRHRFRYTTSSTTYRFRARTIRTAAFPYATGTSRVASVVVRP